MWFFCSSSFKVELNHLNRAYKAVCDQMTLLFRQRLWYIMLEQFLMKYVWSGTGMIMVSIPIIFGDKGNLRKSWNGYSNKKNVNWLFYCYAILPNSQCQFSGWWCEREDTVLYDSQKYVGFGSRRCWTPYDFLQGNCRVGRLHVSSRHNARRFRTGRKRPIWKAVH